MSQNSFQNFLAISEVLNDDDLYEARLENNASGQVLFYGVCITPQASTADPIWYIKKFEYDVNGFLSYIQLPVNGLGFTYSWDLRDSYFV